MPFDFIGYVHSQFLNGKHKVHMFDGKLSSLCICKHIITSVLLSTTIIHVLLCEKIKYRYYKGTPETILGPILNTFVIEPEQNTI